MLTIERALPEDAPAILALQRLANKPVSNIRLYQRAGNQVTRTQSLSPTVSITCLEKAANAAL